MQIILKTLWALSLVVFSATYVFGQEGPVHIVYQDQQSANHSNAIYFNMVDATDGYTAETGLSPTCTILYPSKTSYVSCPDTVTEIGTGTYRVRLSNGAEWEGLGHGSLYITATGARPARPKYQVLEDGARFHSGSSLVKAPSDLNNSQQWGLVGATATSNSTVDYYGYPIGDTLTGNGASAQHAAKITNIANVGGSRLYYGTVEIKSGTLNNAWVGDDNWAVGLDVNTSTGAISPTSSGYLRGWKLEKLASSWWRAHWLYQLPPTDSTAIRMVVALGNGTVGTAPPTFSSSGTMIFARAYLVPAESVGKELLDGILPSLASASSTTSVTLDANDSSSSDVMNNRQICFSPGYVGLIQTRAFTICSCITAYNGTTKVATLSPGTYATLSTNYKYKIGDLCLPSVTASSVSDKTGYSLATSQTFNTTGSVGSVTANVNAQVVGMNADTLTSSAVATSAAQEIGDTTLRRSSTNIEGSSFGDTIGYKSLYGVIAQQTHKSNAALGVRNTYKADGTTVLNARSYTSDPLAKPITGLD